MAAVPTILASVTACAASAIAFLVVARRLARRPVVDPERRLAMRTFVAWWLALAACAALEALLGALAYAGVLDVPTLVTARVLGLLLMCAGLWGLLHYVAFVLTGRRDLLVPLGVAYGAVFAVCVHAVLRAAPLSVGPGAWTLDVRYADPDALLPAHLALFVPPLLAALAYGTLAFRLRGAQRLRVAALSGCVLLLFATLFAAERGGGETWAMLSRPPLALAVSAAALAAYRAEASPAPAPVAPAPPPREG